MKVRHQALVRFVLVSLVVVMWGYSVQAATWEVSLSGSDNSGSGSVAAPYATIQFAIDVSAGGDTIIVQPGIYSGDGNRDINFGGKPITLRSSAGPEFTIIECGGGTAESHRAFVFNSGETKQTVVDGFTVRGGGGVSAGGAVTIMSASPLFENCRFESNSAGWGGAIYANTSGVTFSNCSFENNFANSLGGALFFQYGRVEAAIDSCLFVGNSAAAGGAICVGAQSYLAIDHCTFAQNSASQHGSAIYQWTTTSGINIYNSIFAFNLMASPIYCDDAGTMIKCSDIFGNEAGDWLGAIKWLENSYGNLTADPLFADMANGDFQILPASECHEDNNACDVTLGGLGVYDVTEEPTEPEDPPTEPDPPASGSLAGFVTCQSDGLFAVPIQISDPDGIVKTTYTDGEGWFSCADLEEGTYDVSIIMPLGYTLDADIIEVAILSGVESTVEFDLEHQTLIDRPRGPGFWKHQVKASRPGRGRGRGRVHKEVSIEQLCDYVETIRFRFHGHPVQPVTVVDIDPTYDCNERLTALYDILSLRRKESAGVKATRQIAVMLLNIVSNRLALWSAISENNATVAHALVRCDQLLNDDDKKNDKIAGKIAGLINDGEMVPDKLLGELLPPPAFSVIVDGSLPDGYELHQNYPNPFNPSTSISFTLPYQTSVTLSIYNILGRRVKTIADDDLAAGEHSYEWKGDNERGQLVSSGVYFYLLETDEQTEAKKMLLLK